MNTTEFKDLKDLIPTLTQYQKGKLMLMILDNCTASEATSIIRKLYERYQKDLSDLDQKLIEFSVLDTDERNVLQAYRENVHLNFCHEVSLLEYFRSISSEDQCRLLNHVMYQAHAKLYEDAVQKSKPDLTRTIAFKR